MTQSVVNTGHVPSEQADCDDIPRRPWRFAVKKTMVRALLACLMLAVPAALVSGPASAQACVAPPGYAVQATLTADPPEITGGQTTNLVGTGFLADCDVNLSYNPEIGVVRTDADGNFTYPWVTTCNDVGNRTVTATDGTNTLTTPVNILQGTCANTGGTGTGTGQGGGGSGSGGGGAGSGGGGTSTLPRTGSDFAPLLRVGVVMLALGAIAVFTARRRNEASA